MFSGPCMTIVLSQGDAGDGAIDEFRELMVSDNLEVANKIPTRYITY